MATARRSSLARIAFSGSSRGASGNRASSSVCRKSFTKPVARLAVEQLGLGYRAVIRDAGGVKNPRRVGWRFFLMLAQMLSRRSVSFVPLRLSY